MSVPSLTDTGCAECNRRELAVHTAQVMAEHKDQVIAKQAQRIAELEQSVKALEKQGKGKR
jgi:hypothetical protein